MHLDYLICMDQDKTFSKATPLLVIIKCLFNNETPQLYSGEQSKLCILMTSEIVIELLSSKYNKKL